MSILLGIDTGGTYTDAVLLDDERGILATAKALTTKHELSVGIREAIEAVLPTPPVEISMVSLSTTLATNAVVEGQGSPVCSLLLGYDPETLHDVGMDRTVARDNIVFLQGGHTGTGEELAPLDMKGAEEAIRRHSPRVSAFAVSGFFGVRNPTHELRVRQLVRDLTGLPVTCGHELTTHLNAPRRALTVSMNARLIPLLSDLVRTVRDMLRSKGIRAPLMVVKGDGSLMEADMALERPVETILSGPAASVVGACFLTDATDSFVIDMGGTTTDIAAMRQGQPVLNEQGVRVGNWDIMVEAIDVYTTGLGGDSETVLERTGELVLGPRRVVPLSLLAEQDPDTLEALRRQMASAADADQGRFVRKQKNLADEPLALTPGQQEVWRPIGDGSVALVDLLARVKIPPLYRRYLDELTEQGLVAMSAFTPTDAVHVLGRYRCWSVEAAELGAALWARQLGETPKAFSERVVRQVEVQAGRAIMASVLAEEGFEPAESWNGLERMMIDRSIGVDEGGSFSLSLSLERPVVAIGAPVSTYLPAVTSRMNAELRVPEHAAVANAIGTVAGGVAQTVRLLIRPVEIDSAYRVHLPSGTRTFNALEEAVARAQEVAEEAARELALRAGADQPRVKVERIDRTARGGGVEEIYMETEVIARAVGRPRTAPKIASPEMET
ncbi:MAG: hydantoinase/oxoprolinase N-terminal domain-containing protein [Thermodesulfobacteriota bacterium]